MLRIRNALINLVFGMAPGILLAMAPVHAQTPPNLPGTVDPGRL